MALLSGIGVITGWMTITLTAALLARQQRPEQPELSRKIVHIGMGAVIPLAWHFDIPAVIAIPFAVFVTLGTAINHRWRMIPAVEDVDRNSYGTIAYGLAITLLLLMYWPERADSVCAGVLVMALGDGLAGVIGREVPSPRWSILKQTKSVVGTTTMLVVSLLVVIGLAGCIGRDPGWSAAMVIAIAATGLEQLSPGGIDNLSVPLAVSLLWNSFVS